MNITVNGKAREVERGVTLDALVVCPRGVAVALNGAVVPVTSWSVTLLAEGDAVEIVTATQGG